MSVFSKKRKYDRLKKVVAPFILSSSVFSCAPQITNADVYTWKVKHNFTCPNHHDFLTKIGDEAVQCEVCRMEFYLRDPYYFGQIDGHSHVCDLTIEYDDVEKRLVVSGSGEVSGRAFFEYPRELDKSLKYSRYLKEVNSIIVKEGVRSVADKTFSGMPELKKLDLSHVDKVIGDCLCGYCHKLEEVIFNEHVEEIRFRSMFTECENIESIILPKKIDKIGRCGDDKYEFEYFSSTFEGCTKLTKIENFPKIPKYVKSLECTFAGCSNLPSMKIDIEDGSELYLDRTFSGCGKLFFVDINPENISDVSTNCFEGCSSLEGRECLFNK